jgi:hypothetical protein
MRAALLFSLAMAMLLGSVYAAPPVATASSAEPFQLRGARVPTAGVPSWPLMAGDEIATENAAATITFRDGSRVTLARNSRAKLEQQGDNTLLRLLDGSMRYLVSRGSGLRLASQGRLLNPTQGGESTVSTRPVVDPEAFRKEFTTMAPPRISRRF